MVPRKVLGMNTMGVRMNRYIRMAVASLHVASLLTAYLVGERVVPLFVFICVAYLVCVYIFNSLLMEIGTMIGIGTTYAISNSSAQYILVWQFPRPPMLMCMLYFPVFVFFLIRNYLLPIITTKKASRRVLMRMGIFAFFFLLIAVVYYNRFGSYVQMQRDMSCEDFGWKGGAQPIRIIDVFPLNVELDMLQLRIANHFEYVDHIVILESSTTFQGKKKPFYLDQVWDTLPLEWRKKIIRVRVLEGEDKAQDPSSCDTFEQCIVYLTLQSGKFTPHKRKAEQKNMLIHALDMVLPSRVPNEWVIFSDLDEVIDPRLLSSMRQCTINPAHKVMILRVPEFVYNFNCAAALPWNKPRIIRRNELSVHCPSWLKELWVQTPTCLDNIREEGIFFKYFPGSYVNIMNGGWHMSWFMNIEQMRVKIQSNAHQERNKEQYLETSYLKHMQADCMHFSDQPLIRLDDKNRPDFYTIPRIALEWMEQQRSFWKDLK